MVKGTRRSFSLCRVLRCRPTGDSYIVRPPPVDLGQMSMYLRCMCRSAAGSTSSTELVCISANFWPQVQFMDRKHPPEYLDLDSSEPAPTVTRLTNATRHTTLD
jgi:hypothetical protein